VECVALSVTTVVGSPETWDGHQRNLSLCVQDNTSWLRLLTHLQAESVPHKCVECLRDLKAMHEAMTIDDIYEAYSQVRTTPA